MKNLQRPFRVIINIIPMRAGPGDGFEVISQAAFSEEVNILESSGEWLKIMTLSDNYPGWIKKEGIAETAHAYSSKLDSDAVWIDRLSAHLYHVKDTIYGPLMTLPYNSKLVMSQPVEHSLERWLKVLLPEGGEAYIQSGDVVFERPLLSNAEMCALGLRFLGLPYTWGGRSSFGYDCSGFVQMLYQAKGIALPRDSKDQISAKGFADVSLDDLKEGDLLFFGFSLTEIRHVGVSLGGDQFLHTCASVENAPFLRISSLKDPAWNGKGYYPYRLGRKSLS